MAATLVCLSMRKQHILLPLLSCSRGFVRQKHEAVFNGKILCVPAHCLDLYPQCERSQSSTVFSPNTSVKPLLQLRWRDSRCRLCSGPFSAPAVQDWACSQNQPPLKEESENCITRFVNSLLLFLEYK